MSCIQIYIVNFYQHQTWILPAHTHMVGTLTYDFADCALFLKVLAKGLQKRIGDRYKSVDEMATDLFGCLVRLRSFSFPSFTRCPALLAALIVDTETGTHLQRSHPPAP